MGSFPERWKVSKVAPIFKAGVKYEMGKYGPIFVLSTVARVFKRFVYDQLSYFMQQHKYLSQYQSGFRKFHSTITAMPKTPVIGYLIWIKSGIFFISIQLIMIFSSTSPEHMG